MQGVARPALIPEDSPLYAVAERCQATLHALLTLTLPSRSGQSRLSLVGLRHSSASMCRASASHFRLAARPASVTGAESRTSTALASPSIMQ